MPDHPSTAEQAEPTSWIHTRTRGVYVEVARALIIGENGPYPEGTVFWAWQDASGWQAQPKDELLPRRIGTPERVYTVCELQASMGAVSPGQTLALYQGRDARVWSREENEFAAPRFSPNSRMCPSSTPET